MNSFERNSAYETQHSRRIYASMKPLLTAQNKMLVVTGRSGHMGKTGIDRHLQSTHGDFTIHEMEGEPLYYGDLKLERKSRPNLFFETCSNAVMDPKLYKPGWGRTLDVEKIWYCFTDQMVMACISLVNLRSWLDERIRNQWDKTVLRASTYEEREQSQHKQANVTKGLLIRFSDLPPSVLEWSLCLATETPKRIGRDRFISRISNPEASLGTENL